MPPHVASGETSSVWSAAVLLDVLVDPINEAVDEEGDADTPSVLLGITTLPVDVTIT